ncbi:MAG: hypothetical protein H6Q71_2754 [Firmicutes bacterium]|nr:hypothetical protein [Bacillota bacterium]
MKWSKKLVSVLLLGYLVLAVGGLSFAMHNPPPQLGEPEPFSVMADKKLTTLVQDGTISQDQKDGIVAFFKERDAEMKDKKPPRRPPQDKDMEKHHQEMLSVIQKAGNLTTEQVKAVDEALKPPAPPQCRPEPPAPR